MTDFFELIRPLAPQQMMTFCRALFEVDRELEGAWQGVADRVNGAHPDLGPHQPRDLQRVYNAVAGAYPELAELAAPGTKIGPARGIFLRLYYELISSMNPDQGMGFMNLGYAPLDGEAAPALEPEDEPDRLSIQLYHHLAAAVDLRGKDLAEVGCGRGGGSGYISRYLGPRSVRGVDITRASIEHCRRVHCARPGASPGLSFLVGHSADLPLPDRSCDAVINVESSHCYPSMPAFLQEVGRVLRPGGTLLFCDIRNTTRLLRGYESMATLEEQLAGSCFEVARGRDITRNVMRARELDSGQLMARWQQVMDRLRGPGDHAVRYCSNQLGRAFLTTGDTWYKSFEKGEHVYLSYILQRRAG